MFKKILAFVLPVFLIVGYSGWAYAQPLPALKPVQDIAVTGQTTGAGNIAWSPYGQQAVGVKGAGILASQGEMTPTPMASVAKVMVALAVLQQKPLQIDEQGPNVPITNEDVLLYQQYMSEGQSVAAVQAGEKLSEYQALQALLLPSGNNIATTLTNWAFGSQSDYLSYANNYAKNIGMTKTTFTDASGNFTFSNLPAGKYTLVAHQEGFADSKTTITVSATTPAVANFEMVISGLEEQVTVTGSGSEFRTLLVTTISAGGRS